MTESGQWAPKRKSLQTAGQIFIAMRNPERVKEVSGSVAVRMSRIDGDVYFGRQYAVLTERSKIKKRTMDRRENVYLAQTVA